MAGFGQKVRQLLKKGHSAFDTPAPLAKKASAVSQFLAGGPQAAFFNFAAPRWTGRSYEQMMREGYCRNVIVHRCVRIIAESVASVPFTVFRGDRQLKRHALVDLLRRPNPLQSGEELLANFYAFFEIAGNAYMEVVTTADGRAGELYVLRPERMKVVPGPNGWPLRFEYKVGAKTHSFTVDAKTGRSPILHLRTFHPADDHYGLSPLEPSNFAINIHNASSGWNKALLDNAARPSGALTFEPADGAPATLSDEQFRRLKDELEDQYQGSRNAGRPFLLEGGLKWQQMAMSPHDMEFIQSKNISAREIALAFGIPPMLLGIPGDNTYSNYQEANRAVWRLTLLPLLEKVCAALNNWLVPRFGEDLRLDYDRDAIPALSFDREMLWNRVGNAQFLTPNEKRKVLGFEPMEGGDTLMSSTFLSPGGEAPGFFSQGGGGQTNTSPFQGKNGRTVETKGIGRAETAACYSRQNKIQKFYEAEAAKDPNISFEKIWRSTKDPKTRFSHRAADGQTVALDESFNVGGEQLFLPCDLTNGTPSNVFGCRCHVEYRKIKLDPSANTWNPEPVSNGNKAYLTDEEIAWSVYNEQRGLREMDQKTQGGIWLESARLAIHVIMNGEEKDGPKRPSTAPITQPKNYSPILENKPFNEVLKVVKSVRKERQNGIDAASKRIYFVQRYLCEPGDTNVCNSTGGRCCFVNLEELSTFPEPAIGNLIPWKVIGPLFNKVAAHIPKDRVVYMVAFDGTDRGQVNP